MIRIVNFETHVALVHTIQAMTNESTADILSYFHGLAMNIADNAFKQYGNKRFSKDLVWYYKDTCMPYRLTVAKAWHFESTSERDVNVDVKFPGQLFKVNAKSLVDDITAAALLQDPNTLAKFPKPKTRVPKGLNDVLSGISPPTKTVDYNALPKNLKDKYAPKDVV